jgi:hypothetical protein
MKIANIPIVLLVILAMLTLALTSLQAQDSATNAPARPISDAQFKKILDDTAKNGKDRPILPQAMTAFGISFTGTNLMFRSDSFHDKEQYRHAFVVLNNGNYFFTLRNTQFAKVYYVDKNLVLISALTVNTKYEITVIPNKDAQIGLNAELKFFAGIADQL